jgi:hypothetical protein
MAHLIDLLKDGGVGFMSERKLVDGFDTCSKTGTALASPHIHGKWIGSTTSSPVFRWM